MGFWTPIGYLSKFFFYNYGHSAVIEAGISLPEALSDSAAAKEV